MEIDLGEVLFSAVSVGKSLYQTEEEQRCAQPPHHTEPLWDPAGKAEEVVDVIHDHGHQGDPLEARLCNTPGFGQCAC